jgi:hypothetical protein
MVQYPTDRRAPRIVTGVTIPCICTPAVMTTGSEGDRVNAVAAGGHVK